MDADAGMSEERLGRLLDTVSAPAAPAALERRILAGFDRVQARRGWARRLADAVWPGGPVWQPMGAFAAALLIGIGVAAFAPFDLPQQDDGSSNVFALDGSPDIDAGHGI